MTETPLSEPSDEPSSGLVSRNVRIGRHRTSVRLEPEMWDALNEVASFENCSVNDLCGAVHDEKEPGASFTGALRVFLVQYYRDMALKSTKVGLIQKRLGAARENGRLREAP